MIGAARQIRGGTPGDAAEIARIYVETWQSAYPGILPDGVMTGMSQRRQRDLWHGILSRDGRNEFVLVADSDADGVVGFASAGRVRPAIPGYRGEVYTLYVHQDYQGRGLGRGLLAGSFRALLNRGHEPVLIWVLATNPARFFYEAVGGQRVADRAGTLGGTRHVEIAYGWSDLRRAIGPGGPCAET